MYIKYHRYNDVHNFSYPLEIQIIHEISYILELPDGFIKNAMDDMILLGRLGYGRYKLGYGRLGTHDKC